MATVVSGGLGVIVGGRLQVRTDDIRRLAALVDRSAGTLEVAARGADAVDPTVPAAVAVRTLSLSSGGIGSELDAATTVLRFEAAKLTVLAQDLELAASRYAFAESANLASARLGQDASGFVAVAGTVTDSLRALFDAAGVLISGPVLVAHGTAEKSRGTATARATLDRELAQALNDPRVIDLLRRIVDDPGAPLTALSAVSPPLALLLLAVPTKEQRRRLTTELALAAARVGGWTGDVPVAARQVAAPSPVVAPTTVDDMVARVPDGGPVGGKTRVEAYPQPDGETTYIVYIGGTEEGTAFDPVSNLLLILGEDSPASRAVVLAMQQAGVPEGAPVTFVGYSQGALVAAHLAGMGRWSTDSIVEVGTPALQLPVPADVPVLALAHQEDPVVAASGNLDTIARPNTTVVTRSALDAGNDELLAGHELSRYEETARQIDLSADPDIVAARSVVLPAVAAAGTATIYTAERVEPTTPVSGGGRRAASGSPR